MTYAGEYLMDEQYGKSDYVILIDFIGDLLNQELNSDSEVEDL